MTATLFPGRPNLDQLKRQAKDLLRSARAHDPACLLYTSDAADE